MLGADPANRVAAQPDPIDRAGALAAAPLGEAVALPGRRPALDWLAAPVDAASLAVFRIAFGLVLLWEVWKYVANGWVARYYVDPTFHFTYYGFEWVQPWPGPWMYVHVTVLGVLAACIALGACYRLAAALFFLGILVPLPAGAGSLPEPPLPGLPARLPPGGGAGPPGVLLRRLASRAERAGRGAGLGALDPPVPGRRPVRLRRDREAERRLAGRRAGPHLARRAQRAVGPRAVAGAGVAGLHALLRRPPLRPVDRAVAALAADPGAGAGGGHRRST